MATSLIKSLNNYKKTFYATVTFDNNGVGTVPNLTIPSDAIICCCYITQFSTGEESSTDVSIIKSGGTWVISFHKESLAGQSRSVGIDYI